MILVDATGQAWDVECTEQGVYTTQNVSGGGPSFVLINDITLATTYQLSILPAAPSPELVTTTTSYQSAPTAYTLYSPSGVPFFLQVNNGRLQTSNYILINLRLDQGVREEFTLYNPNARLDQANREAFEVNNPDARLDQADREAFEVNSPHAGLDQVVREAYHFIGANVDLDQAIREAFSLQSAKAKASQVIRESWVPVTTPTTNPNLLVCLVVT